jgi:predicted unusual protein kinase regulating ubiquinone biosynthesis (AarF/ABC1/UbiB family)
MPTVERSYDPRVANIANRHESAETSEATFKSTASSWSTGSKVLVGILSLTVVVPLALWMGGAFKRRLHVQRNGADGQSQRIDTKITRADWSKVVASAQGTASAKSPQQAERLDRQVRGLALRILRSASPSQFTELLKLSPESIATEDLSRVAKLVASGKTEVLDDLISARKSDAVGFDEFVQDLEYKANQPQLDTKFRPGSVVEPLPARASMRVPAAVVQEKAVRALVAELLYSDNPAEMSNLNDQGERMRDVLKLNIDTLHAIALDPDKALGSLPAGLGDVLRKHLNQTVLETLKQMLPAGPLTDEQRSTARTVLDRVPTGGFRYLANGISTALDKVDFNKAGLDQLSKIDFSAAGEGFSAFLKNVFERYFNEQSPLDKRAMVASWLRHSTSESDANGQMVALLKGSGPYLLKVLQLAGDKAPTEELKSSLAALKSELTPLHPQTRKALLAKLMSDVRSNPNSQSEIGHISSIRPLGAASVGETVSATVASKPKGAPDGEYTEQRLVIKLLRPGIAERAARDREIFMRIANEVQKGMPATIAGIAEQIDAELDLNNEAQHVSLGQAYNQRNDPVVGAMRTAGIAGADRQYLLLERAPGSTVKQYIDLLQSPERKPGFDPLVLGPRLAKALNKLSEVWFAEAIFGSGLYHGDLHSGNVMFDGDSQKLTMIDFGNAAILKPSEQRAILNMGFAVNKRYPTVFMKEFVRLLSPQTRERLDDVHDPVKAPGQTRRQLLAAEVKRIITANPDGKSKDTAYLVADIVSAAGSLGIEIPPTVANIARSMVMLAETIDKVNQINDSNVVRAFDAWNELESKPFWETLDNAKGKLTSTVSDRFNNHYLWSPPHYQQEIQTLIDQRPRVNAEGDLNGQDKNTFLEDLLGPDGDRVDDMNIVDLERTLGKLWASGEYNRLLKDLSDPELPKDQKTGLINSGFLKFMGRVAPLELAEVEKATNAIEARINELQTAANATYPLVKMWKGADRAGRDHKWQAVAMFRGNYIDMAFKRAKVRDEPPDQKEDVQVEAAVDPEVLKFEREVVAPYLEGNSNSVAQMVEARRSEKGGLISQSSD